VTLLSGDDFTVLPFIACGGKGVVSVSANVAPKLMAELVAEARGGNWVRARELQIRLNRLHHLLFQETNPIPIKWALHCMKLCGPDLRLPLVPPSLDLAKALEAELSKLGLLS
jgi:4-hydroxy-tetrahydrodipicolinate synthase